MAFTASTFLFNGLMRRRSAALRAATSAALLLAAALPAAAQAPTLAMLGQLERGLWQLRDRESDARPQTICLGDARLLLQPRHPGQNCQRYVIEDAANSVTVHYSCPGTGHGHTSIRRETNRLVQIDTQGVAANAPFSLSLEARRIGPCTGG